MPISPLIGEGVGTDAPKLENLVKIALLAIMVKFGTETPQRTASEM